MGDPPESSSSTSATAAAAGLRQLGPSAELIAQRRAELAAKNGAGTSSNSGRGSNASMTGAGAMTSEERAARLAAMSAAGQAREGEVKAALRRADEEKDRQERRPAGAFSSSSSAPGFINGVASSVLSESGLQERLRAAKGMR